MFSGIVRSLGSVVSVQAQGNCFRLAIQAELFAQRQVCLGDSILTSGVCLTVIERQDDVCLFDLATETREVTTLSNLRPGSRVNVEPSLRVGDAVDGHYVFGHVDGMSTVLAKDAVENTMQFTFSLEPSWQYGVVPKGSIAVNGVSLTVGEVNKGEFTVFVVPHTLQETNFSELQVGEKVNIEIDMLARYVKQVCGKADE